MNWVQLTVLVGTLSASIVGATFLIPRVARSRRARILWTITSLLLPPVGLLLLGAVWTVRRAGGPGSRGRGPIRADEDVCFTVYRPRQVAPEVWHPLLVFAYAEGSAPDGPAGAPTPIEEVRRQAEALLGGVGRVQERTAEALAALPGGEWIVLRPHGEGLEFNPPERAFRWQEAIHREEFRFRVPRQYLGATLRGRVTAFMGGLILADVPLSLEVVPASSDPACPGAPPEQGTSRRYRRIFASYSHRDSAVVEQVSAAARILGDEFVRDTSHLRTGQRWQAEIDALIEGADLFQLFWSWNAMRSPHVRHEWEHALSLNRPGFIRPVWWGRRFPELPGEDLPPSALREVHFQRIDVAGMDESSGRAARRRRSLHRVGMGGAAILPILLVVLLLYPVWAGSFPPGVPWEATQFWGSLLERILGREAPHDQVPILDSYGVLPRILAIVPPPPRVPPLPGKAHVTFLSRHMTLSGIHVRALGQPVPVPQGTYDLHAEPGWEIEGLSYPRIGLLEGDSVSVACDDADRTCGLRFQDGSFVEPNEASHGEPIRVELFAEGRGLFLLPAYVPRGSYTVFVRDRFHGLWQGSEETLVLEGDPKVGVRCSVTRLDCTFPKRGSGASHD